MCFVQYVVWVIANLSTMDNCYSYFIDKYLFHIYFDCFYFHKSAPFTYCYRLIMLVVTMQSN